jgi:hypothetical protein
MPAPIPYGDETLVNTTTAGNQQNASVTIDPNGNFVIAWDGNGAQAGNVDGAGVFFQRYNAAGVKQGSETLANQTTANTQNDASIAMDANGNFVVTWVSTSQPGETVGTTAVVKRDFNTDGTPNGGETIVNATFAGNQSASSVAMNAYDQYVVAWQGNGAQAGNVDNAGVFSQRYAAAVIVDTASDVEDGTVTSISALLNNRGADGKISLREAIAREFTKRYGLEVVADEQVTVCCGTTEAMMSTMMAIIDPGDEVVIFEPFYENYGPDATLCGATPVLRAHRKALAPLGPEEYPTACPYLLIPNAWPQLSPRSNGMLCKPPFGFQTNGTTELPVFEAPAASPASYWVTRTTSLTATSRFRRESRAR